MGGKFGTILHIIYSLLIVCIYGGSEFDTPCNDDGCCISDYDNIICQGNFNLSSFLSNQTAAASHYQLKIANTSLSIISSELLSPTERENKSIFNIETILIENAPLLSQIHLNSESKEFEELNGFRAINTKLNSSNVQEQLSNFTLLQEFYVGEQSHCPENIDLLLPCSCTEGALGRTTIKGNLMTWNYISFGRTTAINCNGDISEHEIQAIFTNLTSSKHFPSYFDSITISSPTLKQLPARIFANFTFHRVNLEKVNNLSRIHPNAFNSQIQILNIDEANFTSANQMETNDVFSAFKSIKDLRILQCFSCGLPFIPQSGIDDPVAKSLRTISIMRDRKKHPSGVSSIGSYAFSWAPNLSFLNLAKNFISKFEPFAFASNHSSTTMDRLEIDISGNPFNDSTGLAPNAFSSSVLNNRVKIIKFQVDSFAATDSANDPNLKYLPENVFKPFLEENDENLFQVDYFNLDIICDCKSAWMFQQVDVNNSNISSLRPRVENGIQTNRIDGNVVRSIASSILCKADSSFDCFSSCISFSNEGLLLCGKGSQVEGFNASNITKLVLASKDIEELNEDAFDGMQLKEIQLNGCESLKKIHPKAFHSSRFTLQQFSSNNMEFNFSDFNLASFPNLETITLDSNYTLSGSTLDFTTDDSVNDQPITLTLGNNGILESSAFTKLKMNKTMRVVIGTEPFNTMAYMLKCKPSKLKLDNKVVIDLLEANSQNHLVSQCYFECSCDNQWMHDEWEKIKSRVSIWYMAEYFGQHFFCTPPGSNATSNAKGIFEVDNNKFKPGNYFKDNC